MNILFLCTGNICRSPMAEVLLRHRLGELGVDARVASAGRVRPGQPASDHGVEIIRARGIDLSAHRSQATTRDLLRSSDLILAMAREHVRDAVVLDQSLWPRTFTLKELIRRGELSGPRRAGEPLTEWLARVGQGRRFGDLSGASSMDDVADPFGGPRSAYERMVAEMDGLIDRLVALVFAGAMAPR